VQIAKLRALTLAALVAAGATGCNDFLTGGELSTDPNRPTAATNRQLFVGVQSNSFATLGSDLSRITGLYNQYYEGTTGQYYAAYTYSVSEQTTNGFQSGLYAGGGFKDVRALQDSARSQGDTLFLGIAQVQEALLIGTGADLFGDLVYSQAGKGTANPALDEQLAVYDSVQAVLGRAVANLSITTLGAATNLGPGASDLNYAGNRAQWLRLAHTLRARFYLHTAEVRPAAYAQALAASQLGIVAEADNYEAVFSGGAGESNFLYQFTQEQRPGYIVPGEFFVDLLTARSDPRLEEYFGFDDGELTGELGDDIIDPAASQPIVTAQENLLIWAETAYRAGNEAAARTQLLREKAIEGAPITGVAALTGRPLLNEILTEKYIALFTTIEPFNDYKRTCTPNLPPVVPGQKIPARFLYDTSERQTNTSVPEAQEQPTRNDNDPPNAISDGTGAPCLGQ
jgi:hypothetical protein